MKTTEELEDEMGKRKEEIEKLANQFFIENMDKLKEPKEIAALLQSAIGYSVSRTMDRVLIALKTFSTFYFEHSPQFKDENELVGILMNYIITENEKED